METGDKLGLLRRIHRIDVPAQQFRDFAEALMQYSLVEFKFGRVMVQNGRLCSLCLRSDVTDTCAVQAMARKKLLRRAEDGLLDFGVDRGARHLFMPVWSQVSARAHNRARAGQRRTRLAVSAVDASGAAGMKVLP